MGWETSGNSTSANDDRNNSCIFQLAHLGLWSPLLTLTDERAVFHSDSFHRYHTGLHQACFKYYSVFCKRASRAPVKPISAGVEKTEATVVCWKVYNFGNKKELGLNTSFTV